MNYFEQIIAGSEENILLLLGHQNNSLNETTKKALFKRNVEIINLELSYLCNRKCDYCPVSSSPRKYEQKFMASDLLKKICIELSKIRYENRISLNLYNEPLLDNALEEKITLIRTHLPYSHIGFNTNGDKLTLNRLKGLSDAGCDYICVTLHPPPNTNQSNETIFRRVSKLLKKLDISPNEVIDLEQKKFVQFRAYGLTLKIQWPEWRVSGTNRAGILVGHISRKYRRNQPCMKPFREFTVYSDGKVQPCCEAFHDDLTNPLEIGNLNISSIFQVYTEKALSNFRRSVFDFGPKNGICKHCNVSDYSLPEEADIRRDILSRGQFQN